MVLLSREQKRRPTIAMERVYVGSAEQQPGIAQHMTRLRREMQGSTQVGIIAIDTSPVPAPHRPVSISLPQVTLAKVPYVEEVTGFPVGTIPPLGHRTRVPTLVDAELLKYSTIIGGAGLR